MSLLRNQLRIRLNFVLGFEDKIRKKYTSELSYYSWREQLILKGKILPLYSGNSLKIDKKCEVYFMADEYWTSGGMCDRFRGIVSLFSTCNERNIPFYIYWQYPFNLKDYLVPNKYNWEPIIPPLRTRQSLPFQIMSYFHYSNENESNFQKKRIETILNRHKNKYQLHIYTNAHYSNKDFGSVFSYLFKPSVKLQSLISSNIPQVPYISMSFRFVQLLGDFKDRSGGTVLSECQKYQYLDDSIKLIEKVYKENKNIIKKIFIASDSKRLCEEASRLDYVFLIPGQAVHTELPADNYDKEFLDFFAISKSIHAYLCVKGLMYTSSFPYYASLVGDTPFDVIEY